MKHFFHICTFPDVARGFTWPVRVSENDALWLDEVKSGGMRFDKSYGFWASQDSMEPHTNLIWTLAKFFLQILLLFAKKKNKQTTIWNAANDVLKKKK